MIAGTITRIRRMSAVCVLAPLMAVGLPATPVRGHAISDFPASRADRTLAAFARFNIHAHEALRRCADVIDRNDLVKPNSLIKIVTYDISYMWANIRSILGPGRDPKRDPKVLTLRVFYAQAVEATRIRLGKRFDGAPREALPGLCDAERRALLKKLPHFRRLHRIIVNGVAQ